LLYFPRTPPPLSTLLSLLSTPAIRCESSLSFFPPPLQASQQGFSSSYPNSTQARVFNSHVPLSVLYFGQTSTFPPPSSSPLSAFLLQLHPHVTSDCSNPNLPRFPGALVLLTFLLSKFPPPVSSFSPNSHPPVAPPTTAHTADVPLFVLVLCPHRTLNPGDLSPLSLPLPPYPPLFFTDHYPFHFCGCPVSVDDPRGTGAIRNRPSPCLPPSPHPFTSYLVQDSRAACYDSTFFFIHTSFCNWKKHPLSPHPATPFLTFFTRKIFALLSSRFETWPIFAHLRGHVP